jgi:predicted nucleic acid-binding Zn ribbon protein
MKSKYSGRTGGKKRLSARRRWEEGLLRNNATAPLGIAIRDLIAEMGVGARLAEQSAVTNWEQAVGEIIARETHPKSIKQGVLKVKVKDAAWRQELSFMKEDIIGKLNHVLGQEIVSDIIFS